MRISASFQHYCLLVSLIFVAINTSAAQVTASQVAVPEVFDIATDPDFFPYRQPLVDFFKTQRVQKINNICILGERYADGTRSAWIIWHEGGKMILWDGNNEPMSASRRILDLVHDVVPHTADIKGSTYLVTRSWVRQLKMRCEKFGTKVKIKKSELASAKEKTE
jgi:hypothetical protein